MSKRLRKRVGAVLFGLLTAVLAAELWGRVLVARGRLPNRMPADLFASHSIGWTLEPGLKARISTVSGPIEVAVNEVGFRDENYPVARTGERARVLVLGDSFTLALEMAQDETFHARLERLYGGEVEVISLAASGYDPTQELLAYEHIGRDFDPDVVLLAFYVGNDLINRPRSPEVPYYSLDDDGQLRLHNFPYDEEFEVPLVPSQRSTPLMKRSMLAFMIGSVQRQRAERGGLGQDVCDYLYREYFPDPTAEDWALTEAILLALRDAVQADGGAFRVVLIPTEFQIEDPVEDALMGRCEVPEGAFEGANQARLVAFLEANDVRYLDLTPALQAARLSTDGPLYSPKPDIHWTSEGHAVAAEALFEWLDLEP